MRDAVRDYLVVDTRNLDKHGKPKEEHKVKWKPPPKSKAGEALFKKMVTEQERMEMDLTEMYYKVQDILYLKHYLAADPEKKKGHFNNRDLWMLEQYERMIRSSNATSTVKLSRH